MASLTNAIHLFQRGGQSREEFIAQVDQALASDKTDSAQLLEILSEEHTKFPLPQDVYVEVQRRIESRRDTDSHEESSGHLDETHMQTELLQITPRPSWPASAAESSKDSERVKGVGDTLNGRFELKECLGVGGMGTVYKALDLRKLEASDRNPYIAIKVLNVQFRGHPKSLIALQREAKKAQTLAHPNIVTVYDFDRDGSMVYLTMEYLSGKPLNRVLRAPDFKGMPYQEAMRIVEGMSKALAYAHQRGFVHCDFKPANVFLTDSGEVKVIDFGIARVFQRPEEDSEATVFDPGSLGGLTPAYASPEMLEHREPDPRDDVYALGCITYELLAGRHPFDRLSAIQARNAGLKPKRPPTLSHRRWLGLRAALSFERETRTRSVMQFLENMRGGEWKAVSRAVLGGATAVAVVALIAVVAHLWESRNVPPAEGSAEKPPLASTPPIAPTAPTPPAIPAPVTPAAEATRPTAIPVEPERVLSLSAVTPVLAGVPCSALDARVSGSELSVAGYVSERYGLPRLKETLSAVPGVKRLVTHVEAVGDENCGAIEVLAPYWVRNRQVENGAGRGASIHTKGEKTRLIEGDNLIVDITTPAFDSFVNVDYYVNDGSVVHLVPSRLARQNQAPPSYSATIGGLGTWVIAKPFGTELIALVIAPTSLFDGVRPDAEPKDAYLQALKKRLDVLAKEHGPDRIAVDFVQITTRPRKP